MMLQLSQSEASASSLKTPSALARNATLFLNWRADVKIWQENPCVEAKTLYNQLREFRLPKWLNDIDVPREDVIEGEGDFYRELKEWGGQQHDPSVDNADTYHLHTFLPMLCLSFIRIKNSKLQNEASQGRRIDDIIEFAFGLKKGRKFDVLYDSHIRLRKSPNVAVSPNAIADTLVTFRVTNLKGRPVLSDIFLRTAGPAAAPNVSWSPDPPDDISVIAFPSEYKRLDLDTNCNRIIIDFCTAQSQRRSLGAEDDIIFGMAAARGEAVIYSCWWEGDEMFYAKHEAWMLTDPRQFIGFYVFLCNLADHARKSLQTMFASYEANDHVTALITHLWRAPDPPPKRSYKRSRLSDGSSDDRQAVGNGDVGRDDLEPAEEVEYGNARNMWREERKRALDQVADSNISLSRDHVKKLRRSFGRPSDGKEALTVSVNSWRSSVVA